MEAERHALTASSAPPAEQASAGSSVDQTISQAPHACSSESAQTNHGAVLELFTSEGCSSCPPADALLTELVADAARDRLPVYALSFHVDYWNYLGWKDAFSAPQYSERQQWYANGSSSGVYTPELVVNGRESFVGSNGRRARSAIDRAFEMPWPARVSLSADEQGHVTYRVLGGPRPAHLNLALVQRHALSQVSSGENRGSALSHTNVVRAFERVELKGDAAGTWTPHLPAAQSLQTIAYVQDARDSAILGATVLAVPCAVER